MQLLPVPRLPQSESMKYSVHLCVGFTTRNTFGIHFKYAPINNNLCLQCAYKVGITPRSNSDITAHQADDV